MVENNSLQAVVERKGSDEKVTRGRGDRDLPTRRSVGG